MPQIARLNIDLVARTAKLVAGFKNAQGVIAKFRFAAAAAFKAAGVAAVAFTGAVTAVGAALWRFTRPAFKAVDTAAKLADQIGISVNELLAFQQQSLLTGTSTEVLNQGMLELTKRIGEAQQGYGEGARGLKMLGLSADELSKVGIAESMKRVMESIRNLESPTQKVTAAYAILGGQGQELVTFMNAGREGLDRTAADMAALGLTISRIDAAKIEFANDQMTRMGAITEGLRNKMAAGLAPTLSALIEFLLNMGRTGNSSAKTIATGFDRVNRFIATLINTGMAVRSVFIQLQQGFVNLVATVMRDEHMKKMAGAQMSVAKQEWDKAIRGEFGNAFLKEIENQNAKIGKAFETAGETAAGGFEKGLGGRNWLSDLLTRPGALSLAAFRGTKSALDFLNKPRFGGAQAREYTGSAALTKGSQGAFAAIAESRYFRKQSETAEKQLSVMEATKNILSDIKETGLAILPAVF
uniref:Putative tail protein n=1 Tax=viral metagenome TaxID=1070528 RepID=A0A6M3LCT2_9ZZZZ